MKHKDYKKILNFKFHIRCFTSILMRYFYYCTENWKQYRAHFIFKNVFAARVFSLLYKGKSAPFQATHSTFHDIEGDLSLIFISALAIGMHALMHYTHKRGVDLNKRLRKIIKNVFVTAVSRWEEGKLWIFVWKKTEQKRSLWRSFVYRSVQSLALRKDTHIHIFNNILG